MLQNSTPNSVQIVWFTSACGKEHYVEYGQDLKKVAACKTIQLSSMREDLPNSGTKKVAVYRHEATLDFEKYEKVAYRVKSFISENESLTSALFSCTPTPPKGTPLNILLTSDHQGRSMVAANIEKAKEICPDIHAIFFAGDHVTYADSAAQWFADPAGCGFFPCLQGHASRKLGEVTYRGGPLLQFAPIFCAIGNHEVMGRVDEKKKLDEQFNDPFPKKEAEKLFALNYSDTRDESFKSDWIKKNSYNTDAYEEIFSLPTSEVGGKKYYATTFGDVRLVVLYATRIWRNPESDRRGKYSEDSKSFSDQTKWGHGDLIFEPIQKGSAQYQWIEEELNSQEFQQAKYKIVMLHHPLHSLGENSIPPFTNPIQTIEYDQDEKIKRINYHYPKKEDYLIRDLEPLFIEKGVQLVLCGHSHIWNRFKDRGMHHLETSNVGNTHGVYLDKSRSLTPEGKEDSNYSAKGDPNGLLPIMPTCAPLSKDGVFLPYLSSNTITAFTLFHTETGNIDSYYFDTEKPDNGVVLFDRFSLNSD